jgi:hypothetical protein
MFSGNFVIFQTKIFFISILSDYRKVNKLKNMVGNVERFVIGEKTSARLLLFLSIFAEEYFLSLEYLVVIATNGSLEDPMDCEQIDIYSWICNSYLCLTMF